MKRSVLVLFLSEVPLRLMGADLDCLANSHVGEWKAVQEFVDSRFRSLKSIGSAGDLAPIVDLLEKYTLSNLAKAAECPWAISALYDLLGQHVREGVTRGNLPTSHLHFAFRMFHMASNWNTYGYVNKAGANFKIYPIKQWHIDVSEDMQRMIGTRVELKKQFGSSADRAVWPESPSGYKPYSSSDVRIKVVTLCDYPASNNLPLYAGHNKRHYTEKHGYELISPAKAVDSSRPPAWSKIQIIIDDMEAALRQDRNHGDGTEGQTWYFWLDCDSFVLDVDVTLEHFMAKYFGAFETNKANWEKNYLLLQEDGQMLNTAAFFVKQSTRGLKFLKEVYSNDRLWIDHPWWENASALHLLLYRTPREYLKYSTDIASGRVSINNSIPQIYPPGVVIASQKDFNSYHPITARLVLHESYEDGDFVISFNGVSGSSSPLVAQTLYRQYFWRYCELNDVKDDYLCYH